MKYLVIDAAIGGTGIRDKYEGGYISAEELGLSLNTIEILKKWLLKYEEEYFNDYLHEMNLTKLDQEGRKIALLIKTELKDVKLEYFSDSRLTLEIV